MKEISIIGSGLAGTLLAIYMVRRGYQVNLFESRPDMRKQRIDQGRSINLALSCRGITGLAGVQLMPEVEKIMVPMRARAIHLANGEIKFQPFGRHPDEFINAILRSELNELLLNTAEKEKGIQFHFNMKLEDIDLTHKRLYFSTEKGKSITLSYQLLIGADGASSIVRDVLVKKQFIHAKRQFLPHGYKELSISKKQSGIFVPEHLHLWPRESYMLLGNPNRDQSITGSLFLPMEGSISFASLQGDQAIKNFFQQAFPDAFAAMPNLLEEYHHHPTGHLSTVTCSPWFAADHCLLIGDAAHGLVPFFGQGMNSAFEDCRILNEMLEQYHDNWQQVLPVFYASRKINTDAVAKMSMDNYHEIQSDIRNPQFILRKQIEHELMHHYPNQYISKHVLVMFSNMPYAKAQTIGLLQQALLDKICNHKENIDSIDWHEVDLLMKDYDKKLAKLNKSI